MSSVRTIRVFFIVFFAFLFLITSPKAVFSYYVWDAGGGGYESLTKPPPPNDCVYAPSYNDPINRFCPITLKINFLHPDLQLCAPLGGYTNTCCNSSAGCTAADGTALKQWDYNYAEGCYVKFDNCRLSYKYATITCGAYDTCVSSDGPYLRAGQCGWGEGCDSTGCRYSGIYKTCCEVSGGSFTGNLGGNCIGGCRTGTCPRGSVPVMCGVSANVCEKVTDQGYACTTASCGKTACEAVMSATPSPPPPGATPTPTPIPPGSPGKAAIWLFVDSKTHYVGDKVHIQVCQKPNCCWDHHFYYDPVDVNAVSGPRRGTVCSPTGWKQDPHCHSCATIKATGGDVTNTGQDKNCVWDTTGWPAGTYILEACTGGHSGQGYCNDGRVCAREEVTISPLPLPCPTNLSASCNADGTATFNWSVVTGAVSYALRVNKDPYDIWNPVLAPSDGTDDFATSLTTNSFTHPLARGVNWQWSIHPVAQGEIYFPWQPNVCYAQEILNCPVPTCTVTLSPSSITLNQGEKSPLLAIVGNVQGGTVNRVVFSSSNTSVATVNPSSVFSFPYPTTVTTQGVGSATLTGNVYFNPGGVLGCSATSSITVNPVAAWFQTQEGDVHAGGTIFSKIPPTATSKYFSLKGAGGYHGVVSYNGDTPSFGSGSVSESPGWLAQSQAKRNSYELFVKLLEPTFENPRFSREVFNADLPSGDGVKAYNGNIQTGNNWNIGCLLYTSPSPRD